MLKKIVFLLLGGVIIPTFSNAQMIDVGAKQHNPTVLLSKKDLNKTEVQNNTVSNKAVEANAVSEGAVLPEGEALTEEETPPPPANVTVEERIEIETESKKNIRKTIKKQDTKEREISLGIMNWAEKEIKIRELMAGGMSYKDAKKNVEETVMLPKMNVKKDKDVEKYLYKKGAFIADEQ